MKIRGFSFFRRDKVEAALKVSGLFIPVTKGRMYCNRPTFISGISANRRFSIKSTVSLTFLKKKPTHTHLKKQETLKLQKFLGSFIYHVLAETKSLMILLQLSRFPPTLLINAVNVGWIPHCCK